MASDNVEIEIKVPVSESQFQEIEKKLRAMAKLDKESRQFDEYYTPSHRDFIEKKYPYEWLSIRRRGEKAILSYKHFYPEDAEDTTHCAEFEAAVSDATQMESIFKALDFRRLVAVDKVRRAYNYQGELEVAMDKVDGLGHFVEIEALKDFGGIQKTRERVFRLAEELGIDASTAEKRGYPYLLMKKNGLV